MNYRHSFHAGNHGDVLKHLALVHCLAALKRKDAPFAALDAHAGRGWYDLGSEEAQRSPEWRAGVARLMDWPTAPASVRAYLDALARAGAEAKLSRYPGSPMLIAEALRPCDRLAACELHGEEFAALKAVAFGPKRVELHRRDGWEALGALLPFRERRGLILIDPPYEAPDELARAGAGLKAALRRFGHGLFLWWRPFKDASGLDRADAELGQAGLRADLWLDAPRRDGKLVGSSLVAINPPFGLDEALREALPALAQRMGAGAAGWALRPLS
jgi:23S rRNA (adenine2030-N6)-methyltransferase